MSRALIGCLLGAITAGGLSNRFGRKRLLTLAALTFAISSLGTGLASHFDAFVVWRIMGGYAIGLASGISPMYIAEARWFRSRLTAAAEGGLEPAPASLFRGALPHRLNSYAQLGLSAFRAHRTLSPPIRTELKNLA
jgi:MFS family permease